jgi:circadian clock protein KaiB
MTDRSKRTIQNIKKICEEHLQGRYNLEVIAIYRAPALAKGDRTVATPTLIKKIPIPIRRFIGELSEREKILLGLDLHPKK